MADAGKRKPKTRFIPEDYSLILVDGLPPGTVLRFVKCQREGARVELDRPDGREVWFDPDIEARVICLTSRAVSA